MSGTQAPGCVLDISAETLSNYRDAALPTDEREHLAEHVPTCAACRERLDGYERAALAIRAERVPSPDARLWRDVRASIARHPRGARRPRMTHLPSRPVLGGLGALVAVLLLVIGFAQLLHRPPTKGPETTLTWVRHTLPEGVSLAGNLRHSLAVVDANTAYACEANPDGFGSPPFYETRIYVTHDRGATWDMATKLRTSERYNYCAMVPDMHIAGWALMVAGQTENGEFIPGGKANIQLTTDAGKTWTQIPALPGNRLMQLATVNGTSFALSFDETAPTQSRAASEFVSSRDGMQTWASIDGTITAAGQYVQQFWVGTGTTLYAQSAPNTGSTASGNDTQLWTSTDLGQTWTRLPTPSAAIFMVQTLGTTTTVCALSPNGPLSTSTTTQFTDLRCSGDGGKAWVQQHVPTLPVAATSTPTGVPAPTLLGYLDDGALLGQVASGTATNYTVTIYRLEPGATAWESLSALPAANLEIGYASTPAPGVFWANGSGTNAGTSIYTADYPATSVLPQGPTLSWSKSTLDVTGGNGDFQMVAPVGDGTNAYACAPTQPNGRAPAVLMTADRGATWTLAYKTILGPDNACAIVADQLDPQVALLAFGNRQSASQPGLDGATLFLTKDGGQSWNQVDAPPTRGVSQLATVHGTTYILALNSDGGSATLYASTDGLGNWQQKHANVGAFWLEPSGTLYAAVENASGSSATSVLMQSSDGGQTWTTLPSPANAIAFVAHPALSAGGQPTFCSVGFANVPQLSSVACSADGGQTWAQQTVPPLPTVRDKAQLKLIPTARVVGVDNTGALLGYAGTVVNNQFVLTLYRLPAGASAWTSIGQLPAGVEPSALLLSAGVPSVLWAFPVASTSAYSADYTRAVAGYPTGASAAPSATPLNWAQLKPPPGFATTGLDGGPDVIMPSPASPANAITAYACTVPKTAEAANAPPVTPHPTFWATHDNGAHWSVIPLPATVMGWCNLLPDQANPNVVLLGISSMAPMQGPPTPNSFYVSFDGGASAQAMPSLSNTAPSEIATMQGVSYAIMYNGSAAGLAVSRDQMRTWQVAPGTPRQAPQIFWVDAPSETVIAQFGSASFLDSTAQQTSIYTTSDGGKTWNHLQGQGMPTGGTFVEAPAGPSSASGPTWMLCNISSDITTPIATTSLTCSGDQGRTWQRRAPLNGVSVPSDRTIIMTSSGALYGVASITSDIAHPQGTMVLCELAPGATTWVERGAAPQYGLVYGASAGVLWAEPAPMMGGEEPFAVYAAHIE